MASFVVQVVVGWILLTSGLAKLRSTWFPPGYGDPCFDLGCSG